MATLHLIHGPVGSGKTTFARQLERQIRAVRFTPDEWMLVLYGDRGPEAAFHETLGRVFELIWEHAGRVLGTGTDVIMDCGFWSRASRDDARRRAAALGASYRLYALTCPADVARQRTLRRTAELAGRTLWINEPAIDGLNRRVEPLGPDEDHVQVDGEHLPAP
ncbi:MAG TPA: ATP-binding protein [Opitutaceae bacterium]|nr:ATP-binding protein [Opitutaceae bacterium]